jgi:hypothetical protein
MRDLMTQTSSVLQITPTCQLQYSETERNILPYSKLNQFKDLNLKLSQPFEQKQLPSTSSCPQPAEYLWSSTPGYQQKPVQRWRRGRLLLTAEFAGAINDISNEHSVSGRWRY